ncbi:splicing factor 3A subunit 3-like [Symsagittifera roscoffensis]|uniref:splicing factor 3A subunit 3-like n=1 Tax=Symsagittifera roscoffensis TaxID=84072 RepID=UPI00307B379C
MEPVLEQQRRYHEERERIIETCVAEQMAKHETHIEKLAGQHRVFDLRQRYLQTTGELVDLYRDRDHSRRDEIQAISAPNEFEEFYNRFKSIKDFHRRHPGEISVPLSVEFQNMQLARGDPKKCEESLPVLFSDEEDFGRYLDMNALHQQYLNLKSVTYVDYITYLATFDRLFEYPRENKNAEYKRYLNAIVDYFYDFYTRAMPLHDIDSEIAVLKDDFEVKWEGGIFPGWGKDGSGVLSQSGTRLDLSAFSSSEELMSLGLDRLKSALQALGLKCGGTLEERAKRLFATKGKRVSELDPSLVQSGKALSSWGITGNMKAKEIASLEAVIYGLTEKLGDIRESTQENAQRKQARSAAERQEELEGAEGGGGGGGGVDGEGEESDGPDEDEDVPYNPKKLPLGWDGKPIPYWLYKLHGLNMYYKCEICGGAEYRGPKAFLRHFAEWRHAYNMRNLGIPNTAHFANVTSIEDAKALWEKIKNLKTAERWQPDVEEEFEDSVGNVLNRKTFDDMRRQGIL